MLQVNCIFMKHIIPVLAAFVLFGTACTKEINEDTLQREESKALHDKLVGGTEGEIIPGTILVKLDPETAAKIAEGGYSEVRDGLFGNMEVKSFTPAIPIRPKNTEIARKYGLDRWFTVEFDGQTRPQAIAERLAVSPAVRSIQYNRHITPVTADRTFPIGDMPVTRAGGEMLFNDPYSVHQWNLHNDGSIDGDAAAGADVGVKDAWRLTGGDPSVIVAVIDRGIAYRHEDLKESMWTNEAEINGTNGKDDDGNGFIDDKYGFNFVKCFAETQDYIDGKLNGETEGGPNPAIASGKGIDFNTGTSHGTHVAGIIAAKNGNGKGISSIAGGNPDNGDGGVRLMSCQIDDGAGGFASDRQMALAFIYAADNGACIAQCSYGEPTELMDDDSYINGDGDDYKGAPLQNAALRYFLDPANSNHESLKGNMAVYAAGNDSWTHARYPGALPYVISVTAIGYDMLPAGYTNHGHGCKIAAPGGEVRKIGSSLYHASMVLSTGTYSHPSEQPGVETDKGTQSQNYVYMYGTSMACPHVSGVLALGISYAHKLGKSFSREEMTSMLLTSVNDLDQYLTGGTKHNSFVPSKNDFLDLTLNTYHGKMGTGLVDAWKLLMAIEGTPSVIVETGTKASIDLAGYCNPFDSYTITVDEASDKSLGLAAAPVIKNGRLEIECGKVGAGKITLSASVGKDPDKENGMGSTDYSREISIVSREFATNNGGWL